LLGRVVSPYTFEVLEEIPHELVFSRGPTIASTRYATARCTACLKSRWTPSI